MTRRIPLYGWLLVIAVALSVVSACSSSAAPQSSAPSGTVPSGTASAHLGVLEISGGYIPEPASPDVAAAYFTVVNHGSTPDTLVKVTTSVTRNVMAMTETSKGGAGTMTDLREVVVPGHGSFRFSPGHAHLMLQRPDRRLAVGDHVTMSVTFAHAGTARLVLPVVPLGGPG
jgi:copper(I)-binding protein